MVVAAVTEVASGSFPHDDDMVTSASVTASAPTCLLVILALISPNHVDRQLSTALVDGQPSRLGDIQWRGRRLGIFGLSDEEAGGLTRPCSGCFTPEPPGTQTAKADPNE